MDDILDSVFPCASGGDDVLSSNGAECDFMQGENHPDDDQHICAGMTNAQVPLTFSSSQLVLDQMFIPGLKPPAFPLTGAPIDADSTQESLQQIIDQYAAEHGASHDDVGEDAPRKYIEFLRTTTRQVGPDSYIPEHSVIRLDVSALSDDDIAKMNNFEREFFSWNSATTYHLSHAAHEAKLDAESRIEELQAKDRAIRDEQHERDLARASGMTVEQYRVAQKPGMEQLHPHNPYMGGYTGDPDVFRDNVTGRIYKLESDHKLHELT